MNQDKVLSSLSLCKKAGLLACGEFQVEEAVKSGKGHLVILAEISSQKPLLTHIFQKVAS